MRLLSAALVVVLSASSQVATSEVKDKFVGTWTLDAYEVRDEAGKWVPAANRLGNNPKGYIIYDSAGNMAVQLMRRDRPRLGSEGWQPGMTFDDWEDVAPEKVKDAFLGYAAYFGTYEVDEEEGSVTHHRKGNLVPNLVGTDVKRFFVLEGDTLTLMPAGDRRLRWKRLK